MCTVSILENFVATYDYCTYSQSGDCDLMCFTIATKYLFHAWTIPSNEQCHQCDFGSFNQVAINNRKEKFHCYCQLFTNKSSWNHWSLTMFFLFQVGTVYQLIITISILISQVLGMGSVLGNEAGWPILLGLTIVPGILQVRKTEAVPTLNLESLFKLYI